MMAYAITKHLYTDIIKYELKRHGFLRWEFIPVRSANCLVCCKTKETHDLPLRVDVFENK